VQNRCSRSALVPPSISRNQMRTWATCADGVGGHCEGWSLEIGDAIRRPSCGISMGAGTRVRTCSTPYIRDGEDGGNRRPARVSQWANVPNGVDLNLPRIFPDRELCLAGCVWTDVPSRLGNFAPRDRKHEGDLVKRQRKPSGRMASKGFPNPIDVHVGNRIRLRRTLLGLSQERLADGRALPRHLAPQSLSSTSSPCAS
jgi:hypothetical protein